MPDNPKLPNPTQPEAASDSDSVIDPITHHLAVNLIRAKLDHLYAQEPDAEQEEAEAINSSNRSKHQQYMYDLTTSGKDLAQIQTDWHNYYQGLDNEAKHQVWREFYASNQNAAARKPQPVAQAPQEMSAHVNRRATTKPKAKAAHQNAAELRRKIRASSQKETPPKLTLKHHLQSALFGLAMGALAIIVLLFGFFNQIIIAPFIQPSRHNTATPIILSSQAISPSATPEVVIPKINVEIPVIYSVNTINESVIENNLEDGVVHYPTTSLPGQTGNTAYFGHSSNNILNPGKYKFAFVLLHDLVNGDVFYLTYQGQVYAYKVFSTAIVNPNDVGVLSPVSGHSATATLITCDPPGTSINRLVVVGDQISPAPTSDSAPAAANLTASSVTQLPGNGPSLWQRFISTTWSKFAIVTTLLILIYVIRRWYIKEFRI